MNQKTLLHMQSGSTVPDCASTALTVHQLSKPGALLQICDPVALIAIAAGITSCRYAFWLVHQVPYSLIVLQSSAVPLSAAQMFCKAICSSLTEQCLH